ncbi:MAG: hypothetical protein JJU13_10265 [Balneolaceae bacterium]|nr:hypothetical protein [Balneolaceae bacterium]
MKNSRTVRAAGSLKWNKAERNNIAKKRALSNPARRDAIAMVKILDSLKSGFPAFEVVFDSLTDKHGKSFKVEFHKILNERSQRNGRK